MKSKYYTICKRTASGIEWVNVQGFLANETSKARAKRVAKEWALALKQTVSVWRITREIDGQGKIATFAEYLGQAEFPAYLRDVTLGDICGNWCE